MAETTGNNIPSNHSTPNSTAKRRTLEFFNQQQRREEEYQKRKESQFKNWQDLQSTYWNNSSWKNSLKYKQTMDSKQLEVNTDKPKQQQRQQYPPRLHRIASLKKLEPLSNSNHLNHSRVISSNDVKNRRLDFGEKDKKKQQSGFLPTYQRRSLIKSQSPSKTTTSLIVPISSHKLDSKRRHMNSYRHRIPRKRGSPSKITLGRIQTAQLETEKHAITATNTVPITTITTTTTTRHDIDDEKEEPKEILEFHLTPYQSPSTHFRSHRPHSVRFDNKGKGLEAAKALSITASEKSYALPNVIGGLIGCRYSGELQLNGCIPDVLQMRDYLLARGAPPSKIFTLIDDRSVSKAYWPTRRNMLECFDYILRISKNGDRVVWYFSGHGAGKRDLTGTEKDGQMEVIIPIDYDKQGEISDDRLFSSYNTILGAKSGVLCWMFFDACHSGTMIDAYNSYTVNREITKVVYARGHALRKSKARIIAFSGCSDQQTSADMGSHGAFTNAFFTCLALHAKTSMTWRVFFLTLNKILRDNDMEQRSELSCTFLIDLDSTFEFP